MVDMDQEKLLPCEFSGEAEKDWLRARQRILLYLQVLNVPAIKGIELALEALRLAQAESFFHGHPTAKAMESLHGLLAKEKICTPDGRLRGKHFRYDGLRSSSAAEEISSERIRSMPPLNRSSMVPEGL